MAAGCVDLLGGLTYAPIVATYVRPLQINFLSPVHRPHLYPVNTKKSIISVFFYYFRFFLYTRVLKLALVNVCNAPSSPNIPWTIYHLEDDRITLKQLYELVVQDELEAIDGIEVTKSCFKRFLIDSSNNGIMKMVRPSACYFT